jgi:RHS repeat-associated protein
MTEKDKNRENGSYGVKREEVNKGVPSHTSSANASRETEYQKEFAPYQPPAVSLPKGGGAIRGMGEKFDANPVTGTGSLSVPLPLTPGRGNFQPQLSLSYNSGAGNGIFGLGWQLSLPSITRKTSKGIPLYNDSAESDVFILSDAEDLVPELKKNGDEWEQVVLPRTLYGTEYTVKRYRPRTEGLFARIEKWRQVETGDTHWRVVTKDNITSIYGLTDISRISDPSYPGHIFSWLLCRTFDGKGNVIIYEYKAEDDEGVTKDALHERNRTSAHRSANRYIKRIRYSNATPWLPFDVDPDVEPPLPSLWHFETVFDYGEHDKDAPQPGDTGTWEARPDPFSQYNSGFELRTYRRCKRVLMFHNFPDETDIGEGYLVRSLDLEYLDVSADGDEVAAGDPCFSRISSITQSGYLKEGSGDYTKESLPALECEYVLPVVDDQIREITREELEDVRLTDNSAAQWSDFYGEGLTGILSRYQGCWYYKRNLSPLATYESGQTAVRFEPAVPVSELPSMAGDQSLRFMDLAGDGRPDIVKLGGSINGFYEIGHDERLSNFRTFESLPNINWNDPDLRFVDLTGDGLADILITHGEIFTWYESLGEEGFGRYSEVINQLDEEKGPRILFSDAQQKIVLADMSGDGLSDIVRIKNGAVCYWPNQGYGRFGAKITMDQSPLFDSPDLFNPKRLLLADIDGSGLTDIIYYSGNVATIYFNLSGNSFAEPYRLQLPVVFDDTMQVSAFDLLGNGTACLVWSSGLPAPDMQPVRYIELMKNGKPHLLSRIVNNFGAETMMSYAPSSRFYLEDLMSGVPWITRLSFPVHVLERVEHYDNISKSRLVTRYAYHHGYFDGDEREFRGFAKVEQWDTESFDADSGMGHSADEEELYLPPVKTVSWFHTGAFLEASTFETRLSEEYYNIDAGFVLPDTQIPPDLNGQEMREAHRALRGSLLRTEVYAEDGTDRADKPYVVTEQSFTVRCEQPLCENRHAVFFAHPDQTLTLNYERNETDPRIAHALTLAVDEFGSVTESASVAYPRQTTPHDAEQEKLWVSYSVTSVINNDTDPFWRRIGVGHESSLWELTGCDVLDGTPLTPVEITEMFTSATEIAYEQTPDPDELQKRCVKSVKQRYLKNDLSGPLPFGVVESLALPYKAYALALTDTLISAIYESRVDTTMVTGEALYETISGAYWIQSNSIGFDASLFYQPTRITDPFGGEYAAAWDDYALLMKSIEDPAENLTAFTPDYRTMAPVMSSDPNGNRTQLAFDPLGRVIATAVMGKEGGMDGDTIDDPTMRFEYCTGEWIANGKPAYAHSLAREKHGAANPRWQESYVYTDGLGREAMTKVQAEPGDAPERDAEGNLIHDGDGNLVISHTDNRWVGSGRTVYDNKGNPVKKYEPFFSSTHEYEDEDDLAQWGVTPVLHYDPLSRLVRTEFPDGTESRVVFDAWYQEIWDQNDCVTGSRWLTERLAAGAPTDERTAAVQTQAHADTPAVHYLDALGRVYLTVEDNGSFGSYETRTAFDIEGNVLSIIDQRGITAFTYKYDIAGTQGYTNNPDAGERWIFTDTMRSPLRTWDSRGHVQRFAYDALRRATHTYVKQGTNPEHLMIRTIYGELLADPFTGNHRGKVYRLFDGAGVLTSNSYDFKGNLLGSTRHIAKEYHQTPNWDVINGLTGVSAVWTAAQSSLETESYSTTVTYDALNRVISSTSPDGSVTRPVYNEANLLESLELNHRGTGTFTSIVDNIDYNARGQRTIIEYANGVDTSYEYDPFTFRMTGLVSTRSSDSLKLQDYKYTFDPVGNIAVFRDNSAWSHLFTRLPVSGDGQYVYDPIYRLIQATGREHPGQQPTNADPVRGNVPHQNDIQALLQYTEQYEYDESGNITTVSHTATGNNWNREYQYSTTGNKLLGTSAPADPPGTYSNTYTYNAHGSMVSMPHITQLSWSYAEQLQSTDLGGGGIVYYCYDSSGNRSRKVYEHSGIVEDRIYLGGYEIYRKTVGATLSLERETLHVSDGAKRILLFETKTVDVAHPSGLPQIRPRWQMDNHLGSSSVELNGSGQVISYEEYHPFGSTSFHTVDTGAEISAKRYRYTGKERDDETGLYYYGARYYASWLGRWLSADPSGASDGLNLYEYVKSNPERFADKDGRQSADEVLQRVGKQFNVNLPSADQVQSLNYTQNVDTEGHVTSASYYCSTKSGDIYAGRSEYSAAGGPTSLASAAAERFIWQYPFSDKGAPGTFRGKILESMYGVPWRDNTKDIDKITDTKVQQIKSTENLDNAGNLTRKATRDAAKYIAENPISTAGKQPQAVIITETGVPSSTVQDIKTALEPAPRRNIPQNAAAPEHVRGLPGAVGNVGKALTGVGTVVSGYAAIQDVKNKDYAMATGDALMAGGGVAEIYSIAAASKAAMTGGLIAGGVGIAITSGLSSARSFQKGDTVGGVVDAAGVAAGIAIAAGVIAGAPVVLAAGAGVALAVGAFHLYRWLSR